MKGHYFPTIMPQAQANSVCFLPTGTMICLKIQHLCRHTAALALEKNFQKSLTQNQPLGLAMSKEVQPHLAKFRNQTGTRNKNKKACYFLCSRLFNASNGYLVGRGGLEPTTKGL